MIDAEKASLTDLRKQLKSAQTAKEAGYNVPDLLIGMLIGAIREKEGIVEVWECSRCSVAHELSFRAREVSCRCGKIRRTWASTKAS